MHFTDVAFCLQIGGKALPPAKRSRLALLAMLAALRWSGTGPAVAPRDARKWVWKRGPWTGNINITGDLVGNTDSQAPPPTDWIRSTWAGAQQQALQVTFIHPPWSEPCVGGQGHQGWALFKRSALRLFLEILICTGLRPGIPIFKRASCHSFPQTSVENTRLKADGQDKE